PGGSFTFAPTASIVPATSIPGTCGRATWNASRRNPPRMPASTGSNDVAATRTQRGVVLAGALHRTPNVLGADEEALRRSEAQLAEGYHGYHGTRRESPVRELTFGGARC